MAAQFPGPPFPHRVVIDNTIGCATGCGGPVGWGCYSLHILKRVMPAGYFPGFARRIVIQRTFSHCRCARIYRNTADFCFLSAVVIVCTFFRFTAAFPAYPPQQTKKMLGCYPQHNSMYSVFHSVSKLRIRQQPRQIQLGQQNPLRAPSKKFSSSPLLSSAHFQNLKNPFHFSPPTIAQQKYFLRQFMLWITTLVPCCYPRHNSKLPVCPPQNLSPPRVIVIQRTFCRIAPILCPSRVVIPRILLFRAQICSYSQHNALVIPRTFRLLSAAQLYLISK